MKNFVGRDELACKNGQRCLDDPAWVCDDLKDCDDNSDEDTGCCMHRVIFNKRMDILGQPFSKAPTAGLKKKLKNCLKRTPDKLGGLENNHSKEKTENTNQSKNKNLYLSSDMIFFNLPHAFAEQIFWSEGSDSYDWFDIL